MGPPPNHLLLRCACGTLTDRGPRSHSFRAARIAIWASLPRRSKCVDVFGPGGAASQDVSVVAVIDASSAGETDFEAWAAYRKAKGKGDKKRRGDGVERKSKIKVCGDGQTLNGFNRRTGNRNRRPKSDSERHLAPKCSLEGNARNESARFRTPLCKVPRSTNSSIPTAAPISVRDDGHTVGTNGGSNCVRFFPTSLDLGGQVFCLVEDSVVVLDTGAAAN